MAGNELQNVIKVIDKEFEKFISAGEIQQRIKQIATQMNTELAGKNPVFLCVLNGAFFFASDLLKEIEFPCEISFVKVSSYSGMQSTGQAKTLLGLDENLRGRNVVVLEDIVDTGFTMTKLIEMLLEVGAESVKVATLILKPTALKHKVDLHYTGFEVADDFLVGYGLDYNKQGRNYKHIYKLKSA
ncbi:MAG: hypoxanthine phosphoribosyltransferase [Sphingobacteriales bacterium]|nr:MAG: hypoxanthine phosphoribosyltransferase [Sphingobacteriales bacterium]